MTRETLGVRLTPWIHAALVGVAAGAAYLEGVGQHLGGAWMMAAVLVVSRGLGALLAKAPKLPRRRATRTQLLEELRILNTRLISATHGLSNQAAVIVGEIELLIEQELRDT